MLDKYAQIKLSNNIYVVIFFIFLPTGKDIYNILKIHPSGWNDMKLYQETRKIVENIMVINDPAERAVKLTKDFNDFGTKSEVEKQKMFNIVEHTRKIVPKATKVNLQHFKQRL